MTRDGIIKDVSETKRVLMSGDFNPKQSETLIGFVNEQIKDYCHSKVDQRIFQTWLEDHLEIRFYDSERRLMQKIEEKLEEKLSNYHTKDDQRIFEIKLDEKFKHFEQKTEDRFLQVIEMIKIQSLAINELSKKMDQINEKHSLS
jgi:hypothetical protein